MTSNTGMTEQFNQNYSGPYAPTQNVCPNCGHCPHCGRSGVQPMWPWMLPVTYPYYPTQPLGPTWDNGKITC